MERRAWLGVVVLLSSVVAAQVYPKEMQDRSGNLALRVGNFTSPTELIESFEFVEPVVINAIWHRCRYKVVPVQSPGGFVVVKIDMGLGCKSCQRYGYPTISPAMTTVFSGQVALVPVPSLFARGEGAERPEPFTVRYPLAAPFVVASRDSLSLSMEFPAVPGGFYSVDADLIQPTTVFQGPTAYGATQEVFGTGCGANVGIPSFAWTKQIGYYLDQQSPITPAPLVDVLSPAMMPTPWQIPTPIGGCGSLLDPSASVCIPFTRWSRVPVPWFAGSLVVQRVGLSGSNVIGATPTLRAVLPYIWGGELKPSVCATHTDLWARVPWLVVPVRFNP